MLNLNNLEIKIDNEYIKLDQLLKLSGVIDSGGQAKLMVKHGEVTVNGTVSAERGKKIRKGDVVEVSDIRIKVI